LKFTDEQRRLLAVKAQALGKRLAEVVTIVNPETVLLWHKNWLFKSMILLKSSVILDGPKRIVTLNNLF
jgi:hypothetical protein